ncbi:hypothetical protein PR202_ga05731 [Eleusine coracana subsp. coracana]|uniref:Glycosyltransferase n=1 Tax=Eleusine coracana subsp. coracana TaxID=191504 RepID=A0AAV5BUX9_ELECO|nr:hypothetical protein QOZ80_5AG0365810 [Eleusine coracana subsp. coracana]GJM89530.1 hypothetical protein PR202_ga05731 [Eleusine coracana subsp. coracana]
MEEKKTKTKTVVLYPGLAVSHFAPMLHLADALVDAGCAVTVAHNDATLNQDAAAVDRAASSNPSVTFHTLPTIPDPPAITYDARFLLTYFDLVHRYTHPLRDFLYSLITPPGCGGVHALVVDMLSVDALHAAAELGVPAYAFFPSNASALATSIQVSKVGEEEGRPKKNFFGEMGDAPLDLRGVPRVPASHLFSELLESPESEIYGSVASMLRRIHQEADGILVNSFESLEPRAVGALGGDVATAPVYCVGPLVAGASLETEKRHECLAWLDEQPDRGVVFLCFGGAGHHSGKQMKEVAVGLEDSGHRFLWAVRTPLPDDDADQAFDPRAEPDLDALLPDGFLERTRGRGLVVVKTWAPQVEVLHHRATGAFVTHCGWNSVLEAIVAGVPMLCWPLYAEQKMNKVFLVEEYGVGVEMVGWRDGMVKAQEVEAKVRMAMEESEQGNRIRARVAEHRDAAAVAWEEGGSSRAAFGRFLLDSSFARSSI